MMRTVQCESGARAILTSACIALGGRVRAGGEADALRRRSTVGGRVAAVAGPVDVLIDAERRERRPCRIVVAGGRACDHWQRAKWMLVSAALTRSCSAWRGRMRMYVCKRRSWTTSSPGW